MVRHKSHVAAAVAICLALLSPRLFAVANVSELTVKLNLQKGDYILGERIKAIVDVANASPDPIDARGPDAPDHLYLELYRASDNFQFEKVSDTPYFEPFALLSGEGQLLETHFADHFKIREATRYFARAVLIHNRMRYESALKSFNVVPGLRCGGAVQMFSNKDGLRREFELVHWGRDHVEHIFLKVKDTGLETRSWPTTDLGPYLSSTRPKVSVLPSGVVVTLHRNTKDAFIRTEFWSLPDAFEFNMHELMLDPDVAGAERVKELYKESGGVEPVKKAWWKFW
jgi:hypothetical protein